MKIAASATVLAVVASGALHAAESAPPAYSPAGSVLQALAGLGIVLAIMWTCVRLLKRYTAGRDAAGGVLRVLGGVAVGQRERVVMVEVGDTWVMLGVAPGRVNALHVMDKLPGATPPASPGAPDSGFAASLARFTQKVQR